MKAIVVQQPWASLIAHGISDIANLPQATDLSGRVLLVASASPIANDLFEQIPVEYSATIGNNILMGNLPLLETLPLNAVIGWGEVIGQSTELTDETPIWGIGPAMVQLSNVHLFDNPIPLDSKLPECGVIDLPQITENNLPNAHIASCRSPHLDNSELIIPLSDKYYNEIISPKYKFINFELADEDMSNFFLSDSEKMRMIKFRSIKLVSDSGKCIRFEAHRNCAVQAYLDDNESPIMVPSIWTPDPIEWLVVHIAMGNQLK